MRRRRGLRLFARSGPAIVILGCCALPSCSNGDASGPASNMTAYSGIHIRMQTKGNYTTEDSDTTPDIGQSAITANRVGQAPPSSGCVVSNYTQISATVTDWPQAAADIANAAGLEAAYKPLLTKVPATPPYDYLK